MKIIGHLDMDAFFAAVEERDNPRLKGRPIVVGSDPENGRGRGVVSTANYKAREFGIRSAMPISKAWQLAESGRRSGGQPTVFMGVNFNKYNQASAEIMEILQSSGFPVETVSIDEAYLDLSGLASYAAAEKEARSLQRKIWRKEKLTASVGIGPNKMVAKIASDRMKPNGLTVIGHDSPEECRRLVLAAISPLPIRAIPGIGPKAEAELGKSGVRTVAELRRIPRAELESKFGKWGNDLYSKARGIAPDELSEYEEAKSIGEQITLRRDTLNPGTLTALIQKIAASVAERFARSGAVSFRTIVITVRFADFETRSRSRTFPQPATDAGILKAEVLRLLMPFLDSRENPARRRIRLLGLRIEKLAKSEQGRML